MAQYLFAMLEDQNRAELLFTVLAVNLLYLRSEICTLLLIRDPSWYRRYSEGLDGNHFEFSPEWETGIGVGKVHVARWEYRRSDVELIRQRSLPAHSVVPPGSAAFRLANGLLDRIL
jgi:hypothetical protein